MSNNANMQAAEASKQNIRTNTEYNKFIKRPITTQVNMSFNTPTNSAMPPPLTIDHAIWSTANTSTHQSSKGKYPMQTRPNNASFFETLEGDRDYQVGSVGKGKADPAVRFPMQPLDSSSLNIQPKTPIGTKTRLPLCGSYVPTDRRTLQLGDPKALTKQEASNWQHQTSIDTSQEFHETLSGSPVSELIAKLEETAAPARPREPRNGFWMNTPTTTIGEERYDKLSTTASTLGAMSSLIVRQGEAHESLNGGQHDQGISYEPPSSPGIVYYSAPNRLHPIRSTHLFVHDTQPNLYANPSTINGYQSLHPCVENMGGYMSWTNPAGMVYQAQLPVLGMSHNYRGNPFLKANQSADIPDEDNTSLWITNLPPICPERLLLGNVKGCGKVYATVINPPDWEHGHSTSAAKLVFMYVSGARALMMQAQNGLFVVDSYVPKVVHNRIKTAAQNPGPESRVLHIEGPKEIVNVRYLNKWFTDRFTFEIDHILVLSESDGDKGFRRLEWRFGSYRCQASSAMTFIEKERRRHGYGIVGVEKSLWEDVNVYYGVDPCA